MTHDQLIQSVKDELEAAFKDEPNYPERFLAGRHPYLKRRTVEEAIREGDYAHVRALLGCVIYGNYI